VDFFTIPTAFFQVLYVFVVLRHDRRRVVHFHVTARPTSAWVTQQLREAFPFDQVPRFLLRDRDGSYGDSFRRGVASMGIEEVLIAPQSPWQNPFAERCGGLLIPLGIVFGPDGNGDGHQDLYVNSQLFVGSFGGKNSSNIVLRYDGVTGAFIDTFVRTDSGGLRSPGIMAFTGTTVRRGAGWCLDHSSGEPSATPPKSIPAP
jgi:hypothetical protein